MRSEDAAVDIVHVDRPILAAEEEERVRGGGFDADYGRAERKGRIAMRTTLFDALEVVDVEGVLRVC